MRFYSYYGQVTLLIFISVVLLNYIYKAYHSPMEYKFIYEENYGSLPTIDSPTTDKVNACFFILTRNSDLFGIMSSIRQLEDRFNKRYHYPYVMVNDEPFTEEFKEKVRTVTDSKIEFGLVPKEHWSYPSFIDQEKAADLRKKNKDEYIYGDSESYRYMCRYYSGFFFRHNLTLKYDYYWRVEPDVQFTCDIKEDPFLRMKNNGGMYGFTISLVEKPKTIPTLWSTTKDWMRSSKFSQKLTDNNAMKFISSNYGHTYNTCHFWSNFEIGNFNLWRSEAYLDYFNHLDRAGGFFYERWGDAPVHSIYASLALNPSQVVYFEDIGYIHEGHQHCPRDPAVRNSCHCDPLKNYDSHYWSCAKRWSSLFLN